MNASTPGQTTYVVTTIHQTPWWCPNAGVGLGFPISAHLDLDQAKAAADAHADDPLAIKNMVGAVVIEFCNGKEVDWVYDRRPRGWMACEWLEARVLDGDANDAEGQEAHTHTYYPGSGGPDHHHTFTEFEALFAKDAEETVRLLTEQNGWWTSRTVPAAHDHVRAARRGCGAVSRASVMEVVTDRVLV